MPISSTNPATIPKWSKFSTLIAELIMTSMRSRSFLLYFNSLMTLPTSGMWDTKLESSDRLKRTTFMETPPLYDSQVLPFYG
jgi:hypothetical protein